MMIHIVTLVLTVICFGEGVPYCPEWSAGDSYTEDFACVGKSKELFCCATGSSTIEWFKNVSGQMVSLSEVNQNIVLADGNRTLVLLETNLEDTGKYRCLARRTFDVIKHDFFLNVAQCRDWNRPPVVTMAPRDQRRPVGDYVSFQCQGFFGSVNRLSSEWNVMRWLSYDGRYMRDAEDFPRHTVHNMNTSAPEVLGLELRITDIHQEDYGQYWCYLVNGIDPQTKITATLSPPDGVTFSSSDGKRYKLHEFFLTLTASLYRILKSDY